MKYFSVEAVRNAYLGFQDCMTNKSWGYLALLRSCKNDIHPSVPYEISVDSVSNFLENIFNLSDGKKSYNGGRSYFVYFSNKWANFFKDQGKYVPNLNDVIVWAYRREKFSDDTTMIDIVKKFSQEFNIPQAILSTSFNNSAKAIKFSSSLYLERDLQKELSRNGVVFKYDNIDAKKGSTVASPGETTRGPFVQPLYAALETADYVLIMQSDYYSLYGNNKCTSNGRKANVTDISSNQNFLTALRTKPFLLLAGISGTGKSRIVRKLAQASVTEDLQREYDPKSIEKGFDRWNLHKPANFELIQVKPNWHNSLEVVGYKSNVGEPHYEFTPFVEFVARAWKHQDIPFFLCLDEMNLAPVEQYFAEFLSAIESRSFENDEYETDPIVKPFNDFGDEVCKMMLDHLVGKVDASKVNPDSLEAKLIERFRTKGLTLPKNLFVMGTVNMDETTFSFSRKVLDRAMSILMNEVNYENFFNGKTENNVAEMSDAVKKCLIDRHINGLDAEGNHADEVKDYLDAVNTKLKDTPFMLGYRAANEALLYVSAANALGFNSPVNDLLDEFTLMKILSRIEGDKRSIGDTLDKLQSVIDNKYPKSRKKLEEMSTTLSNKQFVSYWL